MKRPWRPPDRVTRVVKRVGTKATISVAMHAVLSHALPAGSPLLAPLMLVAWVLVAVWLWFVFTVGIIVGLLVGFGTLVLFHLLGLALLTTCGVWVIYYGLAGYFHFRLSIRWLLHHFK